MLKLAYLKTLGTYGIKTPTQEFEVIKNRLKKAEELYKELIHGNKI